MQKTLESANVCAKMETTVTDSQVDMFEKRIDKMSASELRAELHHLRARNSMLTTSLEQAKKSLQNVLKLLTIDT
jgi:hypothetical protein